jgi:hypothetical protein
MAARVESLSRSCLILVIASGLALFIPPDVAHAGSKPKSLGLLTGNSVTYWVQPSDGMIKQECDYQIQYIPDQTQDTSESGKKAKDKDTKEDKSVDLLDEISDEWHTHGKGQMIAYQIAGHPTRDHPRHGDYEILVRYCCGVGATSVKAGFMTVKYARFGGKNSYGLIVQTAEDSLFKAKPSQGSWTLTTKIDFKDKSKCK